MAKPSVGGAYWNLFRRNVRSEGLQFLLARLAEIGVRKLPDHVLITIVNYLSHDFLTNADYQKFAAATISVAFGSLQREVEQILIEFFEELGKIYVESDNDPDKIPAAWKVRAADPDDNDDGDDAEEDDDMAAEKKAEKAAAAAPVVPRAPEKDKTILHIVGDLSPEMQRKYHEAIALLAEQVKAEGLSGGHSQEQIAGVWRKFIQNIDRRTLTKEHLVGVLSAEPAALRAQMLYQAVQGALNAGGMGVGIRRLTDAATDALGELVGELREPSALASEMETRNKGREAERAKRNGIR